VVGFDARELTPLLVQRIPVAAAETRSFQRGAIVRKDLGDRGVSAKTIERVVPDVGRELAERRDADPKTDEALAQRPQGPPELAVVECDGGRIRTREPGHGPGVHRPAEGGRETKNACLIRAARTVSEEDPQPEPPGCFGDPKPVAKIAETEALSVASAPPASPVAPSEKDQPEPAGLVTPADWHPRRLVRTVLGSIAESKDFGKPMAREAKRRRFAEALAKAFLGDGRAGNGSIGKQHFPDFTPILDVIPVRSYLFLAAQAVHDGARDAWDQDLVWMRGAGQGEVSQVLEEVRAGQTRRGEPPEGAAESDPRKILEKTITDLENNQGRMQDPESRREGLPVTTAGMESLVKEMNDRVQGTEMFWNDPEGAEAILQVRAAALCDDERLAKHLSTRPGCPFTRRPRSPESTAEKIRS
jgi:hypothetical protein